MTLFPFKYKKNQKMVSIIAIIIGFILMVSTPVFKLNSQFTISGFVLGLIIGFLGFIYLIDSQ